jgi:hypothetical protein
MRESSEMSAERLLWIRDELASKQGLCDGPVDEIAMELLAELDRVRVERDGLQKVAWLAWAAFQDPGGYWSTSETDAEWAPLREWLTKP